MNASMYVHVCMLVCGYLHTWISVCVGGPEADAEYLPLSCSAMSVYETEQELFGLTDWPASPRNALVSASPVLGLQVGASLLHF